MFAQSAAGHTHNWSPLKSPNAMMSTSSSTPIDPAPRNAFPANRFGVNGQIVYVGSARLTNKMRLV